MPSSMDSYIQLHINERIRLKQNRHRIKSDAGFVAES